MERPTGGSLLVGTFTSYLQYSGKIDLFQSCNKGKFIKSRLSFVNKAYGFVGWEREKIKAYCRSPARCTSPIGTGLSPMQNGHHPSWDNDRLIVANQMHTAC